MVQYSNPLGFKFSMCRGTLRGCGALVVRAQNLSRLPTFTNRFQSLLFRGPIYINSVQIDDRPHNDQLFEVDSGGMGECTSVSQNPRSQFLLSRLLFIRQIAAIDALPLLRPVRRSLDHGYVFVDSVGSSKVNCSFPRFREPPDQLLRLLRHRTVLLRCFSKDSER